MTRCWRPLHRWCIIHQIRSSTRYTDQKDIKQVMTDLKMICTAVTLDEAEDTLQRFGENGVVNIPPV